MINATLCEHTKGGSFHDDVKRSLLIPLSVLIVMTNAVVIFALSSKKECLRPAYWFLVSLTAADMFVGFVAIGNFVTHWREQSLTSCLVRFGFTIAAIQASIQSLLWISIDRFIAIKYALTYSKVMTPRKVLLANVYLWTQSLLNGFLPLIGWDDGVYHRYCSFIYVLDAEYVVFMFITAVIPIVIIFILYFIIYKHARRHIRQIDALEKVLYLTRNSGVLGVSRQGWKSLKTLTIITGCVLITWCPFLLATIVVLIQTEHSNCLLKNLVGSYLLLLGFTNSLLNPLIYAFRSKEFREYLSRRCNQICERKQDSG